jgi:hypothetical protein
MMQSSFLRKSNDVVNSLAELFSSDYGGANPSVPDDFSSESAKKRLPLVSWTR